LAGGLQALKERSQALKNGGFRRSFFPIHVHLRFNSP
jgi:hypothetical protein